MASSSSAIAVSNLTSSSSLPQIHPISVKLDRSNYLFWKTQVLATARAFGFDDVLQQNSAPDQFISTESDPKSPNPEYLLWIRRDQFIFSWILASLSPTMIGYIGRCSTSADLWKAFGDLFQSQSKARSMQLKLQLQNLKKGDSSIDDYILKFRDISDQLYNIGQPISDSDLVTYILTGLGSEYESVSIFLQSKCEDMSLHEVQFALQTHEIRLLNQAAAQAINNTTSPQANIVHNNYPGGARGRGRFGGRNFGNRGRGRGRYNNYSNNQNKVACQLCGLTNHVALKCYKRFDVSFTGSGASSPFPATSAQANLSTPFSQSNFPNTASSYPHAPSSPFVPNHLPHPHSSTPSAYTISHPQSAGSEWYLDSGASAHVTADFGNMHIQSPYTGNESLTVGQTNTSDSYGRHS